MTEVFSIDNARALPGNGRRALTTVAHLNITIVSHILSHSVTNTRHLLKFVLQIHEHNINCVKESSQKDKFLSELDVE